MSKAVHKSRTNAPSLSLRSCLVYIGVLFALGLDLRAGCDFRGGWEAALRLVGVAVRFGPESGVLRGGADGDGLPGASVGVVVCFESLEPGLDALRLEGRAGTVACGVRPKFQMGSDGMLVALGAPTVTGPGWDHHT